MLGILRDGESLDECIGTQVWLGALAPHIPASTDEANAL
jgi:hypothetical protein